MPAYFNSIVSILFAAAALAVVAPASASAQAQWDETWPEFGVVDGVVLGVGVATAVTLEIVGGPEKPRWNREILLDLPLRKAIGSRSVKGEHRAAIVSDITAGTLILSPLLVAGIGGIVVHNDDKVGVNFLLFSAEAFAVSFGLTNLIKTAVGRARPAVAACFEARQHDPTAPCDPRPNVSFFSGHTAVAFTGAGLLCSFATVTDYYGAGAAGPAVCATALAGATTVAALRLVANKHHLSDVLVGVVEGLLVGWVWPTVRYH